MAVSKDDLQRFIEGQRAFNAFTREETWRRLAALTVEEARDEYEDLCRLWESGPPGRDLEELNRLRLDQLVRLRQRLDVVARRRPPR